jgi:putative ABC transport system permease protein
MRTFLQDLRYGARMLVKNPSFTLIAIITLALGIGANTAIFSVVNAALLRPLPFREPERLVTLRSLLQTENENLPVPWPDFQDWRARQSSFETLAGYYERDYTLLGAGDPVRLRGAMVTSDLFPLLGVAPQLGRVFTLNEEAPGVYSVILSHALWQSRFNADLAVIGRTVNIKERSFTIVGVMPKGFRFPLSAESPELWINAGIDGEGHAPLIGQRGNHVLEVLGRLKPGVTLAQAQAEMGRIAHGLAKQYPETNTDWGVITTPYFERIIGDASRGFLLLLAAVSCVLLIACANVSNLLLARAATRGREIAIRSALGASRSRMALQLLTESLLLALCGGAAGLLLAWWGMDALLALAPNNLPRVTETSLDGRVLGFALLVTLLTGVLFGSAPAWRASKTNLVKALKDGSRGAGNAGGQRLGRSLIVAQVAVTFCLLSGAGLLLNSLRRLSNVNPGFDPRNVLTFKVSPPNDDPRRIDQFYERLVARMEALPGVTGASATFALPLSGVNPSVGFAKKGEPVDTARPFPYGVDFRIVRPNYFRTMGVGLLAGRDFDARDKLDAPQVAIINEAFAALHFPGQNPLGRHIKPSYIVEGRERHGEEWREIIGVVGDTRHASLNETSVPELFAPQAQTTWSPLFIIARADSDPRNLVASARREVASLDKDLPIYAVKTLEEYMTSAGAVTKFLALMVSLFAGLALVLTTVGLYGLISYSVAQRTNEIGIRMAMGAQAVDVLKLVIRQGMTLVMIGVVIGLAASFELTRLMKTLLFEVSATDPLTFSAIAVLLLLAALLACWMPARRATKVDPMAALRAE